MTVQITESNNIDPNLTQHKVDPNIAQQKVDIKPVDQQPEAAPEDPNWRAFREARKQDKAMRDAAEKVAQEEKARAEAFKAALEAVTNKPSPQQHNQYSNDYQQEETEDQRIEKKVQQAIAKQKAEYEHQQIQREKQEYPQRLQQTFSDFNQTISQDNLDYLEYHFPEVARPLQRGEDNFEKWADIYKAVKRFVPNTNHKKDAQKAENNFNKPKSISSTSVSPGGEAMPPHRIDEARKAANWERMQRQLKGV
jgi:exonuclease VII large subunit